MLKGKLDIAVEILGVTVMVALGTYVFRKALATDTAAKIAGVPGVGILITGPRAVMDEAYA